MLDWIATHILALPPWVALLVVFLMPALESSAFVGFVFPGEIALIVGGVLAFQGVVPLWAVLLAGISGAVIGDAIGYLVGRRYGHRLVHGTLGRWIKQDRITRGERYLAERGGKAVFLGRFTAALRVMIPGLAGMAHMRPRTFVGYNVAGGAAWGTMVVLLGYVGGSSWRRVEHLASRIGLGALAVLLVLAGGGFLLHRARAGWATRLLHWSRGTRPVTWFADTFPAPCAWLGRRLDPVPTTGLRLTVLTVIAVGAVWFTVGMAQDVLAHEELAVVDLHAHAWLLQHRVAWLDPAMSAATWLGANAVLLPLLVGAGLALRWVRRSWGPLLDLAMVYGSTLFLSSLTNDLVHRPRPPSSDWVAPASGWAFPSGHTTQATVAWGLLCVLACAGRSASARKVLVSVAALVVLVVACSRFYLGVHWLTDVLAGISLGVAILSLWGITRLTVFLPTDERERVATAERAGE